MANCHSEYVNLGSIEFSLIYFWVSGVSEISI
jgi:hypothetical protein